MVLRKIAVIVLGLTLLAGSATGQPPVPEPILPDALDWFGPPENPSLRGAWVVGSEHEAGPYLLRVMLGKGGRIPPHTHPDTRNSTVLSGTLYVGFGEAEADDRMIAVPAGGVYVAPAQVVHYLWAKDGDVIYQESGFGPTGTTSASSLETN